MDMLLDWPAAAAAGAEVAGGKGWNLGRLHRYGFPVPDGGVLSAAVYRRFMANPRLGALADALAPVGAADAASPETSRSLEHLRAAIMAAPLPHGVMAELDRFLASSGLSHRPVAVRSSASAEDSAAASFAGIHQSFLHVTGVLAVADAVKGCYASLWTPQALAYRRRMDLPDDAVAAAVAILAMVPAKAAGVGFSCDPRTGRLDRFTVSASLGLGEAVVSGQAEPDEYIIDITQYPPVVASRRLGRKAQMTVARAGGGTELAAVSAADAVRPALTEAQIGELAYLIGRIHDALGGMQLPQDMEWAHDGQQFWVLQARPVTRFAPATFPAVAHQPQVWSNANLKDVMPGVQSTLGWSFMRSGIDVLLTAPFLAGGYACPGGIGWIKLFSGRAYFNLTALQWAFWDAVGTAPDEVNRILGGHQPEIVVPPSSAVQRAQRSLRQLRMIRRVMAALRGAPAQFRRLWDWAERAEAESMAGWSKAQYLGQMLVVKTLMEEFLPQFQLINAGAGGIHQSLIKLLGPAFGERAPALVNAMLAGVSGITSAEQGVRLVELGNMALADERVRAWFTASAWRPLTWADALHGTPFGAEFARYLRDYGHRGVYELEPMNPRWREDPTYLLETVRSQVLSGREIRLAGQAEKREAAVGEVFGKLGLSVRRLQAGYFLKQAGLASAHREMAKSIVVKVASVSRHVALAVGQRMVAEGLIDDPADVFHLSWIDMEAYLLDRAGAAGFRALIADRKAQRELDLATALPDVIVGDGSTAKAPPPVATGPVLAGLGVASGRAAGVARVVRHPHEGERLQPGEVLVAPSTDPAWTPLFLRASAVVMEVGGYLSHGAIVAREYGLPAVVNIPGLLRTVRDGEQLTVDGDEGKVYRRP